MMAIQFQPYYNSKPEQKSPILSTFSLPLSSGMEKVGMLRKFISIGLQMPCSSVCVDLQWFITCRQLKKRKKKRKFSNLRNVSRAQQFTINSCSFNLVCVHSPSSELRNVAYTHIKTEIDCQSSETSPFLFLSMRLKREYFINNFLFRYHNDNKAPDMECVAFSSIRTSSHVNIFFSHFLFSSFKRMFTVHKINIYNIPFICHNILPLNLNTILFCRWEIETLLRHHENVMPFSLSFFLKKMIL